MRTWSSRIGGKGTRGLLQAKARRHARLRTSDLFINSSIVPLWCRLRTSTAGEHARGKGGDAEMQGAVWRENIRGLEHRWRRGDTGLRSPVPTKPQLQQPPCHPSRSGSDRPELLLYCLLSPSASSSPSMDTVLRAHDASMIQTPVASTAISAFAAKDATSPSSVCGRRVRVSRAGKSLAFYLPASPTCWILRARHQLIFVPIAVPSGANAA